MEFNVEFNIKVNDKEKSEEIIKDFERRLDAVIRSHFPGIEDTYCLEVWENI